MKKPSTHQETVVGGLGVSVGVSEHPVLAVGVYVNESLHVRNGVDKVSHWCHFDLGAWKNICSINSFTRLSVHFSVGLTFEIVSAFGVFAFYLRHCARAVEGVVAWAWAGSCSCVWVNIWAVSCDVTSQDFYTPKQLLQNCWKARQNANFTYRRDSFS